MVGGGQAFHLLTKGPDALKYEHSAAERESHVDLVNAPMELALFLRQRARGATALYEHPSYNMHHMVVSGLLTPRMVVIG
jgi:hypothetical protein